MNIFNPRGFLQLGGALLIVIGTFGFIGILGPTPARSIFGSVWYFENTENVVYTLIGVVAIIATFIFPPMLQRYIVLALGVAGLIAGLYGFVNPNLFGVNLETPADSIFLLLVGSWALYAVYGNVVGRR